MARCGAVPALLVCTAAQGVGTANIDNPAVRQTLVQAILAEGQDQQKLLNDLADSGAKIVSDVLTAWTRDSVYIYQAPDGAKVPVLLEEQRMRTARPAPSESLTANSSRTPRARSCVLAPTT